MAPAVVGLRTGSPNIIPDSQMCITDYQAPLKLNQHDHKCQEVVSTAITPFDDLVDDIKQILGPSSGIDSADIDVEALMDRIREYDQSHEHEWNKYAFQDPSAAYSRNGVDDINHKANLLILVWNPGMGSGIHDHANAHCIVKMLKGTLDEVRYNFPSTEISEGRSPEELKPSMVTSFHAGDVSYMSDDLGLHRMANPDPNNVAVSLHLYTPPYAVKFGCHVYDARTGKSTKCDMSNLFSDRGVLNLRKPGTC